MAYPTHWSKSNHAERNYFYSLAALDCDVRAAGCDNGALASTFETIDDLLEWAIADGAWTVITPMNIADVRKSSHFSALLEKHHIIVLDYTDNEIGGLFCWRKDEDILHAARAVFRVNLLRDNLRLKARGVPAEYFTKVQPIAQSISNRTWTLPDVVSQHCRVFYLCRPAHLARVTVVEKLRECFGNRDFFGGFDDVTIKELMAQADDHWWWGPIRRAVLDLLDRYPDLIKPRMSYSDYHAYLRGADIALVVRGMAITDYREHAFLQYRKPLVRDDSVREIYHYIPLNKMSLFKPEEVAHVVTYLLNNPKELCDPPAPLALADLSKPIVEMIK